MRKRIKKKYDQTNQNILIKFKKTDQTLKKNNNLKNNLSKIKKSKNMVNNRVLFNVVGWFNENK